MEPFPAFSNPPRVAVLDYGMGNLWSVLNAFRFVGAEVALVSEPAEVEHYDALVFPGQGAVVDCMRRLRDTGFDRVIRDWVAADRPFLGICLGLQALFDWSEEGDTPALGIFPGEVRRFRLPPPHKIPHMGWNRVHFRRRVLIESIDPESDAFYFVHSFYVIPRDADIIWCETDYGGPFCSGVARGHCYATQFHPEKSQRRGLQLYRNFLTRVHTATRSNLAT